MTAPVDATPPMGLSDASPETPSRLRRFAPLAVGLLCLVGSAWASRDLGLTTDEPRYIENSQRLQAWFGDLFTSGPAMAFEDARLAEGWYWARTESKNLPLVSLVGTIGQFTLGVFDSPPHTHRWGNLLVLAATCGVIFTWIREELSSQAATVAVLALVGMPRVWTHAQLMSIDPLVASFQVMGCWALWNGRGQKSWRWPVTFGLLAGIGAMAKPTFWFIVPVWILWGVLTGPRNNWKAGACLVTVAPLVALALMPPWWSNPVGGFLGYIDLLLNDPVGWKIDVYYLGDIFQAELIADEAPTPVPWHSVALLSTVTTPPWIIALILVETLSLSLPLLANRLANRGTRKTGTDTRPHQPPSPALAGLWCLAALALPLIVMLPSTPAHDGTRLYRPAFYFGAILAGTGFERLRRRFFDNNHPQKGWLAVIVLSVFATGTNMAIHPAGLSYYNVLVGGFNEAARPVRQPRSLPVPRRPLFEVSYWWELFNREAIQDMQVHLPQDARVTFFPENYGRHLLKEWGHLREDIQLTTTGDAQYMVMYARMGRLLDPRVQPSGSRFLHHTPIWEWKVKGVRVAVLVKINQRDHSSPGR